MVSKQDTVVNTDMHRVIIVAIFAFCFDFSFCPYLSLRNKKEQPNRIDLLWKLNARNGIQKPEQLPSFLLPRHKPYFVDQVNFFLESSRENRVPE